MVWAWIAQKQGLPKGSFTVLHLDLASLESVRQFVDAFRATGRRLDALVCNAAVYLPTAKVQSTVRRGNCLILQHLPSSGDERTACHPA